MTDKPASIPQSYWDKVLPRAQAHGVAVANHEFACMLNPLYRGPNWTWDKFVPRCGEKAEVTVWQAFSDRDWLKWEKEITEAAGKSGRHAAEEVLRTSGLLEWWPNPTRVEQS